MSHRKPLLRTWLFLAAVALAPAASGAAAQTLVCFKKKCLIYADGTSVCEYTPVDCSKVEIQ